MDYAEVSFACSQWDHENCISDICTCGCHKKEIDRSENKERLRNLINAQYDTGEIVSERKNVDDDICPYCNVEFKIVKECSQICMSRGQNEHMERTKT